MIDKQTKAVFRKIAFTKITVLALEFILIYSLFSKETQLTLLVLSALVVLLNMLFIDLWEGINKERLNNHDR